MLHELTKKRGPGVVALSDPNRELLISAPTPIGKTNFDGLAPGFGVPYTVSQFRRTTRSFGNGIDDVSLHLRG